MKLVLYFFEGRLERIGRTFFLKGKTAFTEFLNVKHWIVKTYKYKQDFELNSYENSYKDFYAVQ